MPIEKGYSVLETAYMLGIKPRTVRAWLHNGKLNAKKIPGSQRWIIMESEIRRLQGNDENRD